MPKGTPLTPEQIADLGGLYEECGNAAAVARELGVAKSTVTRALDRLEKQRRATLQEGALLTALLDGRERTERAIRGVSRRLFKELSSKTATQLFDAQTVQQLGMTLARLVTVLAALDRREEQRRGAQLSREKVRLEIAVLEKGSQLTAEQILALVASLPRADLEKAVAAQRAAMTSSPTSTPSPAPEPTYGEGA